MFDYEVTYKIDGQVKNKIVTLEDYIDSEFLIDFLLDEIEEWEECTDVEILNVIEIVDRSFNIDKITNDINDYGYLD